MQGEPVNRALAPAIEVEESLFDDQITMLSRRYIRALRRSANVETK